MADNYIERQYEAYQARKAAWEKERKYKKKKPADPAEAPHRSGAFLQNQVKKVVAVHDLSGVGHVSLMAVIPVLSSMGFQVCPLPTAVLSAHTQYPTYSFLDLTDEMKRIIENWEKMNVHFDTFYTGYLGSPQQAQIVEEFILKFRGENDMVVVDPVLGDNGHLYKGITEEMVTEMKKLIHLADVITPNLTELYYLLDMPYQEHITDAELKQALKTLSDRGPAIVIATSVPVSAFYIGLCLQPLWRPLLEGNLPLSAGTLSGHGRHVYECHHGGADAGRQSAHCARPRHAVYLAGHTGHVRL